MNTQLKTLRIVTVIFGVIALVVVFRNLRERKTCRARSAPGSWAGRRARRWIAAESIAAHRGRGRQRRFEARTGRP